MNNVKKNMNSSLSQGNSKLNQSMNSVHTQQSGKGNNLMQEFNDLDLNRVREFINILEEHQFNCEKSKKFVDAEIAKQKITQLKQVEKEKILSDMKFRHNEELVTLDIEKGNAFSQFNMEWDKNYYELMEKFVEFEDRLKKQQQEDLNERIIEFEKKFVPLIKPTSEILNLERILSGLIRQKEYIKAHQIQSEIDKLSNIDLTNYNLEKERKLAKEVEKIKNKHFQEYQVLLAKKDLAEAEYNKNRKIEFDKLVQGFKNRLKEIQIHHSYEVMQVTNPKKYNARNLISRGGNRMHSSSSVDKLREGGGNYSVK